MKVIKNRKYDQTYYMQSKNPRCLKKYIPHLPNNVVLLTTLETNRDEGYAEAVSSKVPLPSKRYEDFLALDYPRKIVTIEPMLDFDPEIFAEWILNINPEAIWLGYNSYPKSVNLPEPTEEKVREFVSILEEKE